MISIHAPRTGSDKSPCSRPLETGRFQSTLPARGATRNDDVIRRQHLQFQSTLPARGATWILAFRLCASLIFQSTLPARGATHRRGLVGTDPGNFNPRSPHGERLNVDFLPPHGGSISIHAPRTGSDKVEDCKNAAANAFQSTLPARGATAGLIASTCCLVFQSTLPARGATITGCLMRMTSRFQSTLPARGATNPAIRTNAIKRLFQSTLPARGATCLLVFALCTRGTFQSTLPARGATGDFSSGNKNLEISIHAPRTGSDDGEYAMGGKTKIFQSTLPARGATFSRSARTCSLRYFNPRSPHGERQEAQ